MEYPLIYDCRFAIGENPYIARACKLRAKNSFLCHERFKFNSFIQRISRRPREIRVEKQARAKKWVSSSYQSNWDSISVACIEWLKRFNFPLILVSGISSIYLFSFNLSLEAHGNQNPLFGSSACENVSNYYAHTEKIKGKALKKELYFIISNHHQSLSYKQVVFVSMVCTLGKGRMAAMVRLLETGNFSEITAEEASHEKLAVQSIHREFREADEANLHEEEGH